MGCFGVEDEGVVGILHKVLVTTLADVGSA